MEPLTQPTMFYAHDCEHCLAMLPKLNRLIEERGIEVDIREVSPDDPESVALFDQYDKRPGGCDGVPLFVNPTSDAILCGEVSYEDLVAFVTA